jgi:hypothetical protein
VSDPVCTLPVMRHVPQQSQEAIFGFATGAGLNENDRRVTRREVGMAASESRETASDARTLLLEKLQESRSSRPTEDLLDAITKDHPDMSEGDLKAAIWSLVALGQVEITWEGKVRLLSTPAAAP